MAQSFQLSEAYVQLSTRGNLRELLNAHKQTVTSLGRDLQSGYYLAISRLGATMQRQMATLRKQARFQDLIAEQGRFGAYTTIVGEKLADLRKQLEPLQSLAARTFAASTAAITGFVAAASPDLMLTFGNSLKWVAAEIGRSFIPYAARMVKYIQDVARWIRGMSAEQKDQIAQWIVWGTVVAGAVLVLPRLVAVIGLTVAAVKGLSIALTMLSAHPVVLAITAIALALVGLKLAMDGVIKGAEGMAKSMEKTDVSRTDYNSSPLVQKLRKTKRGGASDEEMNQTISQEQRAALAQQSRLSELYFGRQMLKAQLPGMMIREGMGIAGSPFLQKALTPEGREQLRQLMNTQPGRLEAGIRAAGKRYEVGRLAREEFLRGQSPQFSISQELKRQGILGEYEASPIKARIDAMKAGGKTREEILQEIQQEKQNQLDNERYLTGAMKGPGASPAMEAERRKASRGVLMARLAEADVQGKLPAGGKGLMLDVNAQPQMMAIHEAWRQSQMAGGLALSHPVESETIKIQRESRQILEKIQAGVDSIAGNTRAGVGLPGED